MFAKLLLAAALAAAAIAPAAGAQSPPTAVAIVGARVFDGEKVLPRATVVMRDGKVVAVGAGVKAPAGAVVVDGAGKTLIPGLIDAHTHTFGAAQTDALRFGVTTELDMFAHPSVLGAARRERDELGKTAKADLFSAGVLATAPKGHGTEYGFAIPTLTGPGEAEAWVKARVAEGSDYIKIVYEPPVAGRRPSPSLDRATLEAVIKAAHAQSRLAVVHISTLEDARGAIETGADGLVHTFADQPADAAFYALAARRKVFVVPTLAVVTGVAGLGEGAKLAADPRIAPHLSGEQKQTLNQALKSSFYKADVALGSATALRAAKVDILAGTDAGNPTVAHGAGLHEELALLVRAGLTPTEALKAATSTPARRFGLGGGRGRIVAGGRADLVLVDGDPTTDITATRAIAGIWKNGHAVDRKVPGLTPGRSLIGLLGDFETGMAGPDGTTWDQTSDVIAGGQSVARVSRVGGALKAEGEIRPPFPFAWGGALLFLA